MVAVLGASLIGAVGLAVDIGLYYADTRALRLATEAAALSAANNLADTSRVQTYLAANGYPQAQVSTQTGLYCPDRDLASDQRFRPSTTACPGRPNSARINAIRVTASAPGRQVLSQVLGPLNPFPDVVATATAARVDEAGVGMTSDTLDLGFLNDLLRAEQLLDTLLAGLLGVDPGFSVNSVRALQQGSVDAGLFFDNLARLEGKGGATYGELTDAEVSASNLMLAAAASTDNAATAAVLTTAANVAGLGTRKVSLRNVFALGVWKNMPVGEANAAPALRAGLNAYQLFLYSLMRRNGFNIDLSPVAGAVVTGGVVKLEGLASDPLTGASFAFGPAGEATVYSSRLRLKLSVGAGDLNLLIARIRAITVPLLIDIGPSHATVTGISCPSTDDQFANAQVSVAATSGFVHLYIGSDNGAMSQPFGAVDIKDARIASVELLGLGLISLEGKAKIDSVQSVSQTLVFGVNGRSGAGAIGNPVASQHRPLVAPRPLAVNHVSSVDQALDSLLAALQSDLQVKVLGLSLTSILEPLIGRIRPPVTGLVGAVVDPLLDGVLRLTGIQLGQTAVLVTGVRCGVPVLV